VKAPGFINFFASEASLSDVVRRVLDDGEQFGLSNLGQGQSIQVEFVSANPTGPLHVGHGRGAALGATIANLLSAAGFDVQREYYVNDAGRQMNILALSVWLRYLSTGAVADFPFPSNGYRGDYINDIAATLRAKVGNDLERDPVALFDGVVDDEAVGSDGAATGDKEAHVDALIERAQTELGDKAWCIVFDHGLEAILADIRTDLGEFGVHYDEWFSERSIASDVEQVVERLAVAGHLYEKDGSRWFRSTAFGLRELREEVGTDAARWFYVMRRYQHHLDFDLDLAKSRSNENPVYYVQYAHARICSVMRELGHRNLAFDQDAGLAALDKLIEPAEADLLTLLATWPELLERAALAREPHQVTGYLRDLANGLHSYYNGHKFLVDDDALRQARLCLLLAVRQVLVNGLTLIDVSTPEVM